MTYDANKFYEDIKLTRQVKNGTEFWNYQDIRSVFMSNDPYGFLSDFPSGKNEIINRIQDVIILTPSPERKRLVNNNFVDPMIAIHAQWMEDYCSKQGTTLGKYMESLRSWEKFEDFRRIKLDERTLFGVKHFQEMSKRNSSRNNSFDVKMSRFGSYLLVQSVAENLHLSKLAKIYFAMMTDDDKDNFIEFAENTARADLCIAANNGEQAILYALKSAGISRNDALFIIKNAENILFNNFDVRGTYHTGWTDSLAYYMPDNMLDKKIETDKKIIILINNAKNEMVGKICCLSARAVADVKNQLLKRCRAIVWNNYSQLRQNIIDSGRKPEYALTNVDARKYVRLQKDLFKNFVLYNKKVGLGK